MGRQRGGANSSSDRTYEAEGGVGLLCEAEEGELEIALHLRQTKELPPRQCHGPHGHKLRGGKGPEAGSVRLQTRRQVKSANA